MRLSASDKLRTLFAAQKHQKDVTQKGLAAALGISTRTLRRVKNIPGYKLAPRTLERIAEPLNEIDKRWRRYIRDKAYDPKTGDLVKSPRFRLPTLPVQPLPTLYKAKSGRSWTLNVDTEFWRTQEKIDYLISAQKSNRFLAWTARVAVPVGVAISGDVDALYVNEGDEVEHYMIGPSTLQSFTSRYAHGARELIRKEIVYHEDAGRIIVNISIVENLPEQKS